MKKMPAIVITGASGFIGHYLVDYLKNDFIIYAIARRSRKQLNIPSHPNLHWLQCDITNWQAMTDAVDYINKMGGADFVIHLAAFYDFTYKNNSAYDSINIGGTKNMLDMSLGISAKRFIFASSIAACNFPLSRATVDENSSPDADYHYAKSKKAGELLAKEYSSKLPCTIVRFAAVFSDWCEFAPLYKFLSNWLSKRIDSRIIGGKGESSIPYIHIRDLCRLIKTIIVKSGELEEYNIFCASPSGSTSQKSIFDISTNYFFGKRIKSIHIPKYIAYPGLLVRNLLNVFHVNSEEPFERLWMIKYIDKKLEVDSSYTQAVLNWQPTPRYHITRRLLFLLEKMKSHPNEWRVKNEAALKRVTGRINLILYEKMIEQKDVLMLKIGEIIYDENKEGIFDKFTVMDRKDFECYISVIFHLLLAAIRSSDRSLFLIYIDKIALNKFADGFEPVPIRESLKVFSDVIIPHLSCYKELTKFNQEIYDYIGLTLQVAQDEIEDLYDELLNKTPGELAPMPGFKTNCKELQKLIIQLSAFYQVAPDDFSLTDEYLKNNMW